MSSAAATAHMAGGLVELLVMRAMLKQEAGLERTLIAAADNNPLKLTATAGEAVRWLVFARGQGYLAPDQAIAAAIADLKSFLPAFVQAMQQALRGLLRRFDPAVLEQELADASFLTIWRPGAARRGSGSCSRSATGITLARPSSSFCAT